MEKHPWLAQELLKATNMNYDMCGKMARAVNADQTQMIEMLAAPHGQRSAKVRQLKGTILGATKSGRDKF